MQFETSKYVFKGGGLVQVTTKTDGKKSISYETKSKKPINFKSLKHIDYKFAG